MIEIVSTGNDFNDLFQTVLTFVDSCITVLSFGLVDQAAKHLTSAIDLICPKGDFEKTFHIVNTYILCCFYSAPNKGENRNFQFYRRSHNFLIRA